jgi:hypothetical protein
LGAASGRAGNHLVTALPPAFWVFFDTSFAFLGDHTYDGGAQHVFYWYHMNFWRGKKKKLPGLTKFFFSWSVPRGKFQAKNHGTTAVTATTSSASKTT